MAYYLHNKKATIINILQSFCRTFMNYLQFRRRRLYYLVNCASATMHLSVRDVCQVPDFLWVCPADKWMDATKHNIIISLASWSIKMRHWLYFLKFKSSTSDNDYKSRHGLLQPELLALNFFSQNLMCSVPFFNHIHDRTALVKLASFLKTSKWQDRNLRIAGASWMHL